jgi:hypothetical protein
MSIRKTVAAFALAASAGLAVVAVAQPASAAPDWVCGYNSGGEAYWYNCDVIPHRVHVDVYGNPAGFYVCVDANQVRDLGWSGADWGGVIGGEQVGSCPS